MVYNFDNDVEGFTHELSQNNYQDLKWLSSFLLAYTDKPELITSFEDMYNKKTTDINVNDGSVKYLFTNLQYGRCIRDDEIKEINFSEEHIRDNCDLLVQTILESSHKLYVNWMDVMPIPLITDTNMIRKFPFIENTVKLYMKNQITEINPKNDIVYNEENLKKFNSLSVSDIYNTIRNYLYEEIKSITFKIKK